MSRRAKAATATVDAPVHASAGDGDRVTTADNASRRVSLASRLEDLAQQGALAQAVKEGRSEVEACRRILLKPLGKRSLDDIHMLKTLLSASRLLDFFSNLDAYKVSPPTQFF
ncbi:hypothetical protein Gpo141_00000318 [Globisporangium polare]